MNFYATVIRFRILIIIAFLSIAIAAALQLRHVSIESDLKKLLPENISSRVDTDKIEEIFGGTDILFFVFETDDILKESTLSRLKKIEEKFENIDGVGSVLSLFSTKHITANDGTMIVEPLIDKIPENEEERTRLRERIRSDELAYGVVVSKDFRLAAFMLTVSSGASEEDVFTKAKDAINEIRGEERFLAGGQPVFRSSLRSDILDDLRVLIPAALIIMLGILFAFFRQIRGVLLPFGAVVLSTLFGMGLLPLFGWKITLISVLLPILVVAIANNYGIHLVAKYQELCRNSGNHSARELAAAVLQKLWKPVTICGFTTIAGILGLLSHVILPARQIGIAAAIAIGFSLALSLLGIPAILSMMKIPANLNHRAEHKRDFVDNCLSSVAKLITGHPVIILWVTVIVTAAGITGIMLLRIDANQENFFAPSHPISQCTRLINEHFGGVQNISILVNGDVKDPDLLKRIRKYQDEMEKMEGVGGTTSMADVIKIMSRALNDSGDADYDKIPSTRDAVAQYLEFYSMSGDPEDFERMVDFNYENTQCIVRINNGSTPVVKKIVNYVKGLMKDDKSIKRIGGFAVINAELAEKIISGQISSLLFAAGIIIFLMILLFRSVAAGFLSVVPLAVSAILEFGIMGLFGIPLDIATALITSIVIGAGIDYTIHFLWRYRDELRLGKTYKEAVQHTIITTGRGILFNAMSVMAGFSALFLSSLPSLRSFGLLFCVSIFTCLIGALMVVPGLCIVLKPAFLEPRRRVIVDGHKMLSGNKTKNTHSMETIRKGDKI